MPRIRQLAEKYAAEDAEKAKKAFWQEIRVESVRNGIDTNKALAEKLGVDGKTIGNYKASPETMQVKTMQKFVALLKPDIMAVLLFIGYSEKEIRAFAKQNAT